MKASNKWLIMSLKESVNVILKDSPFKMECPAHNGTLKSLLGLDSRISYTIFFWCFFKTSPFHGWFLRKSGFLDSETMEKFSELNTFQVKFLRSRWKSGMVPLSTKVPLGEEHLPTKCVMNKDVAFLM